MSEADKPFAPTPNRIAQARREGRLPRSAELCSVVSFGAALVGTACSIPSAFAQAGNAITTVARDHSFAGAFPQTCSIAAAALISLACGAAGALVAGAWDGGVHVSSVSFDAARIAPINGLRRMFSRDSLLTAARAAVAFPAAVFAVTGGVREAFASVLDQRSPAAFAELSAGVALRTCVAVLAIGGVFAVLDKWSAHRRWLDGLRMTHDELKRDVREAEGDPNTRGRRTSLHRALVRGSIARVREAAFVVTNPTHIAVALKYEPPAVAVPEILVRACDDAATRAKAIAREHGIPIIEDVHLARALFNTGEAGEAIPRVLYVAVAQVVAALVRQGLVR